MDASNWSCCILSPFQLSEITWSTRRVDRYLSGGDDCPNSLFPQQTITPSSRSPQLCRPPPVLKDRKRSSSGWRRLPVAIVSPADGSAILTECAGVGVASVN